MNVNELYELQCELFRRDTGFVAPGKHVPLADYTVEERVKQMEAWHFWHKGFLRGMEVSESA
jgi:hypothetical protein